MVYRSVVVGLAALAGLSGPGSVSSGETVDPSVAAATADWAQVLARFVNPAGQVDFQALSRDHRALDRFVAWVARVSPRTHPQRFPTPADVLAYHINAYNALAMQGVLASDLPESLGGLRRLYFFRMRQFVIGARSMSLYGYENDIIRKLGEPRVHFALNCMSISCPRLPRAPFEGPKLEQQLEHAARAFFAEPRNVVVDTSVQQVTFSGLLDFYAEDFVADAGSLTAYANRYLRAAVPGTYTVRFFAYDWGVNYQTP